MRVRKSLKKELLGFWIRRVELFVRQCLCHLMGNANNNLCQVRQWQESGWGYFWSRPLTRVSSQGKAPAELVSNWIRPLSLIARGIPNTGRCSRNASPGGAKMASCMMLVSSSPLKLDLLSTHVTTYGRRFR
jgi:hypothetical protein